VSKRTYEPVAPAALPEVLAGVLAATELPGTALRVALDGPRAADPDALAAALVVPLRARGRDVALVRAETFWRDASLRFEHGRDDVDAFQHEWLDAAALRREVLDPLGPGGSGAYLPSLRDPATNRVTRAPGRTVRSGTVLVVSGELLLGRCLPFDVTIHLAMSAAARARRTRAEWAWTLAAFEAYDRETDPVAIADVVIRYDDPAHPAISRVTPRASGTT
jgi:hypothetical protein